MPAELNMRIIVVDDMSTMRKIIKNMLTKLGFTNIEESDDGKNALPMIEKAGTEGKPYSFIVSDWNMPGMQGIELLKKVRASEIPAVKTTKFLMVTAEAEQLNIVEAAKAGVNDYVVKPFTQDIMQKKIEKLFG